MKCTTRLYQQCDSITIFVIEAHTPHTYKRRSQLSGDHSLSWTSIEHCWYCFAWIIYYRKKTKCVWEQLFRISVPRPHKVPSNSTIGLATRTCYFCIWTREFQINNFIAFSVGVFCSRIQVISRPFAPLNWDDLRFISHILSNEMLNCWHIRWTI